MAKYLFGRVVVDTCIVDAPNLDAASQIFESKQPHPKETKLISKYLLAWTEDENHAPIAERDKVLQGFLHLMQKVIPMESEFMISRIIIADDNRRFNA